MIEEKSYSIRYLTKEDVELIHQGLARRAEKDGEPLPPLSLANKHEILALVDIPQRRLFGSDQYPTFEEKAAILFYTINKKQIFLNGNKRMSTACLIVFLMINGKWLDVNPDELTKKALWLAETPSLDFPNVKVELAKWIKENIKDIDSVS